MIFLLPDKAVCCPQSCRGVFSLLLPQSSGFGTACFETLTLYLKSYNGVNEKHMDSRIGLLGTVDNPDYGGVAFRISHVRRIGSQGIAGAAARFLGGRSEVNNFVLETKTHTG